LIISHSAWGDGKRLSPRSILQSLRARRAGLIKDSTIMTINRPMFPPQADSRKPDQGLSRRTALAGIASAAALPIAGAIPAPAAASDDAELIELGTRFELLLEQYYDAQERWSTDTDQTNRATADALHEIHDEMKPLANAINAGSVTSIEGLRVKALVTLWEIEPLCKGETEFSFEDAYPFQQLFVAVAQVCGLNDKIAATGCTLPVIGLAWDDSDEEYDNEAEDA
jgi:hypothetical protein